MNYKKLKDDAKTQAPDGEYVLYFTRVTKENNNA